MAVKVYIERSYTNPPTTVKVEGDTPSEATDALENVKNILYPAIIVEPETPEEII